MAEAGAVLGAEANQDISDFIQSCPLGCAWPKRTVLIAKRPTGTRFYRNDPGGDHAEVLFLNDLEETLTNEENNSTIEIYINYSPCDKCSQYILDFLKNHPDVKFQIIFAHVYYCQGHENEIRLKLRELEENENITLRAVQETDWKEIIKLIYIHHDQLAEMPQGEVEWDMIKGFILAQQFDLGVELIEANMAWLPINDLQQIMDDNNHNAWGTELGTYLGEENRRHHNVAMQLLYNYGKGSIQTILDAANGDGYAFLMQVLNTVGLENYATDELKQELLRKRIVADFVADKELCYIIGEQAN